MKMMHSFPCHTQGRMVSGLVHVFLCIGSQVTETDLFGSDQFY